MMEERERERLGRVFTIRYTATHCLFWMSYACIWGFGALYLQSKGFRSTSVGIITAVGGLLSVVVQPLLAAQMEGGKRVTVRQVFVGLMLLTAAFGSGLLLNHRMAITAVLFLVLSAIFMVGSSVLNSLGMGYVNLGIPLNYGVARGTGSTAYAVLSLAMGFMTERFGVDALIVTCVIFSVCLAALLLTYTSTKKLIESYGLRRTDLNGQERSPGTAKTSAVQERSPGTAETAAGQEKSAGMLAMLREDRQLAVLLLGIALLFIGHFMVNTYLINLVRRFGGTESEMGIASACAAGVELPGMILANYLLRKLRSASVLRISCVMFAVKAALLIFAVNMPILVVSQLLQFGAYAFFTPTSVYYINERVSERYKVTGQAALGMAVMGLGGAFGNLLGGRLLDLFGVMGMVLASTAFSVCGGVLAFAATGKRSEGEINPPQ